MRRHVDDMRDSGGQAACGGDKVLESVRSSPVLVSLCPAVVTTECWL